MALQDYLRVFRRDWPVVVICAILGFALAAMFTVTQKPIYKATASVFVSVQTEPGAADLVQGATFTQQMVLSYSDLARKAMVLNPVIEELHLPVTADQLAGQVDAEAPLDTVIIDITVSDNSAVNAARIANSVSANLVAAVPKVTPTSGRNASPVKIAPVESASVPASPSSPVVPLNLLIGIVGGLVLALIVSVIREVLDARLRTSREFETASGHPVLGAVPIDSHARRSPLISQVGASNARAEAFRTLRTNLQFLDFDPGARALVVTSASKREGRSTSAANLAIALADAGVRTALVDADLREPSIASYFGLDGELGLTDALTGAADLDAVSSEVRDGLTVVPSGRVPPNPSELLQSDSMVRLIDELSQRFETIVFDSPPLLAVSDAAILARRTSGALVVGEAGRTTRHELRDALQAILRVDGAVIGLVVTMLPRRRSRASGSATADPGALRRPID